MQDGPIDVNSSQQTNQNVTFSNRFAAGGSGDPVYEVQDFLLANNRKKEGKASHDQSNIVQSGADELLPVSEVSKKSVAIGAQESLRSLKDATSHSYGSPLKPTDNRDGRRYSYTSDLAWKK